ncbi:MAG: glycosyltransferase [Eubacterium sp.]|nr:glycosyltransferase [Eubacterium sp.]
MPKVSVLIPAYNVEKYIEECLDSVLNQTMQDFEIVCVDDCSTDETLRILREYGERDDRIHVYIHDKNEGQSAGRNLALSKAVGEYVYMLDADDKLVPEALEELCNAASEDNLDLIGFETRNFADEEMFENNARIKTITYRDTEVLNGREALTYCMDTETFSLSVPTFMMRREYLNENSIRFVEGILHEDVGYILELIVRARRVRFLHKVYFLRRIRANSTMTVGFTDRNIEGYIRSFCRAFDLENEPEIQDALIMEPEFEMALRKWQRDIFGRLNQLYEQNSDVISKMKGGNVTEEIRRIFEIVKLSHFRIDETKAKQFTECYLCGTGQYTRRAIQALGDQGVIIRGIISLENDKQKAFGGFPVISAEEADSEIPVILSVSKYSKDEYKQILKNNNLINTHELSW